MHTYIHECIDNYFTFTHSYVLNLSPVVLCCAVGTLVLEVERLLVIDNLMPPGPDRGNLACRLPLRVSRGDSDLSKTRRKKRSLELSGVGTSQERKDRTPCAIVVVHAAARRVILIIQCDPVIIVSIQKWMDTTLHCSPKMQWWSLLALADLFE